MRMRIGIPRTLWYYTYGPFWRRFFTELGAQVVLSPFSTRATLDDGTIHCVSEACLPIKAYFGHLVALAGKVDYIFLPRLVCLYEDRVFCPKFLGLPDLVRHSGLSLPPLLTVRLDRRKNPLFLLKACLELASQLGVDRRRAVRAYWRALREQWSYTRRLRRGETPAGAKQQERPARPWATVAIMGYPYLIFDEYLNLGLLKKLASMGVDWRTVENLSEWQLRRQNRAFGKRAFWRYSDLAARGGFHYLGPGSGEVGGVIHLTAFACGPDAVVDKILELEAERKGRPYLNITLDEQSGTAGYITRLEAFVDMLARREGITSAQN
jgi:predicted nucleotide-binding protein (sugar kinase/HSP70/actin superfamily)